MMRVISMMRMMRLMSLMSMIEQDGDGQTRHDDEMAE